MIIKLKANTTYKLIDKFGYFGNCLHNKIFYKECFEGDTVTLTYVTLKGTQGHIGNEIVISERELEFFEEVVAEPETPEIIPEKVKPLTRTVYRKTTLSTKELLTEMLVHGKVYWDEVGMTLYAFSNGREEFIFKDVENGSVYSLSDTATINNYLYEKVEEELSWQEQLCEEFDMSYVEKGDQFVQGKLHNTEDMVNLAKRIIELSGTK